MIRPGTAADAEDVARVHVASWQAAYAYALPHEQLMAQSVDERAQIWRASPPIVAEVDGQIVGFVSVGTRHEEGADGQLFAIYVHPDDWGKGVGRSLLEAGEQRLRELGHEEAILWVLEDNPRTRRFYEAAGWSSDDTARRGELFGFEFTEVRYSKRL
jgi:ribosomal protein S18 acetylase RimI-like enzyme